MGFILGLFSLFIQHKNNTIYTPFRTPKYTRVFLDLERLQTVKQPSYLHLIYSPPYPFHILSFDHHTPKLSIRMVFSPKEGESHYKNGKKEGLGTSWYESNSHNRLSP
jgi:hypothetical protein